MDAAFYVRIIRLRWRVLLACGILGALAAVALTAFQSGEPEVQITHWQAEHKLVVSASAAEQGRFPNLLQTALLVTGGTVPEAVAQDLGEEEPDLTASIRTVTDLLVNVIEISAVATDPDQAQRNVDAFAAALVDHVNERDVAAYEADLEAARNEVERLATRIEDIERRLTETERDLASARTELAALNDAVVASPNGADTSEPAQGPTPQQLTAAQDSVAELNEDLRAQQLERDTRSTLYSNALRQLDDLERQGPPPPLLETLDTVEPFVISQGAYTARLSQGERGDNNFNATQVDDSSGGGLRLSERVSSPLVRIALGALGGMFVGLGVVLLHLRFDPRLRSKADIEQAFDLPVLAEIPKFSPGDDPSELHAKTRSRSMITESYRMVRSALLFARATSAPLLLPDHRPGDEGAQAELLAEREMRVVMVTSPGPSEGKTTTTANLAVVLAEAGYEVLVINCDYRLPKLHKYFGVDHLPRRTIDTGIGGVTLIADVADGADANPTQVVESQRSLIRKARARYDVILLDTAPILATNDASALLPVVDLVVLVAQEGKTDREAAIETADLLRRRHATVAGVVVTGSSGFGRSRYYYKYRYGNYYDNDNGKPASSPVRAPARRAARAMASQN